MLMCACVRRMCLSHTRTGRGPCFPSALPFGYTVVSQTPLYTTHPIRKATTFTLDNTYTHTYTHGPRRKISAEKTLLLFLWCSR